MHRPIQITMACLLAMTSLTMSALAPPERVQAAGATVTSCDETSFEDALTAVQDSGGGTLVIACSEPIDVTSEKEITSAVTIIGNGAILDGTGSTRLFVINDGAALSLYRMTLRNGRTGDSGGAIDNLGGTLTIIASTFSGNRATNVGGAIRNDADGVLTITASTFSDNDSAGFGGAIWCDFDTTLTITASTFNDNSASSRAGVIDSHGVTTITASTFSDNSARDGGAIWNSGRLTVTASTFSGNRATDEGGAIRSFGGSANATITASTFSGNSAGIDGGAIHSSNFTTLAVGTSVLANSPAGGNCFTSGTFTSNGYNLSDDDSCGLNQTGDIENSASVNLDALADNGGPTQTMLPQSGSAAIDAAACALSSAQDQRGANRPETGTDCDIGAVELGTTAPVQLITAYSPGGDEGSPVTIYAVATGPAGANLSFAFDCDNDGTYETPGISSDMSAGQGVCTLPEDGSFTVGVRVNDGDGGTATGSTTVIVNNVAPTVNAPAVNPAPSDEGQSVTASATFTDAGTLDTHTCTVDYGDGSGSQPGTVDGLTCTGPAHTYVDDDPTDTPSDQYTVTVTVSDDDGASDTSSALHTVNNVAPAVNTPTVSSEPSTEGQSVTASATFSDPGASDTHICIVDYGDSSGPQAGMVDGLTCTGPAHTYTDDDPTGTASDDYTISIAVTDDDGASHSNSLLHAVDNVPPTIDDITTNGPVAQGQPVLITVVASDVGVNDLLTYHFDCDNNGDFETAGVGSQGECALDPAMASSTIGVQVMDDDLGTASATVEVRQTHTLCLNYANGAVRAATSTGACTGMAVATSLPAPYPLTFCINIYTGAPTFSVGGCAAGYRAHIVPAGGPLHYCAHLWTGILRVPSIPGQCSAYEMPGVIPG